MPFTANEQGVKLMQMDTESLQVGSSVCDEEVSSWLGPHGVVQAAARWSIIYYRMSLLLLHVTNALHRDGLPEVNAARLTPAPPDKHCQCLIQKSSSSAKYQGAGLVLGNESFCLSVFVSEAEDAEEIKNNSGVQRDLLRRKSTSSSRLDQMFVIAALFTSRHST
ncbi:unnamed protein product [Pleuronectes platessa]|uniref:Uncharacterized protein n=1 Tax=Pleuronectes platessa TaxID=8262 RepID=A0A9N7TRE4_PLEPL|nr:unnamed protein product [Pleuronectes platessa]